MSPLCDPVDTCLQCDEKRPTCSRYARYPESCKYELKLSWTGARPFKKPRKPTKGGYGIIPTTYAHTLDLTLENRNKTPPPIQVSFELQSTSEEADAAVEPWDVQQELDAVEEDIITDLPFDEDLAVDRDEPSQDDPPSITSVFNIV